MLSTCIRPSSVMLLLALHLCVFTMFGMLLFTGEKVPHSFLSPAWIPWGGWTAWPSGSLLGCRGGGEVRLPP